MEPRYNLDSLGWYQFEWLAQALLKAELGVGIESWGGRGDWGRDAYSSGPLPFPTRTNLTEGPFLFQAKFVSGANAAGATSGPLLMDAVRKESARIAERKALKQWQDPMHYAVITNAPVTAETRAQIKRTFAKATKGVVTVLGGDNVCDLLDHQPTIARSFPQILSIRNLTEILDSIVNRESVNRSAAAVAAAKDIIPVFVPTAAYNRTWGVLANESFAILEGPPEMGKTAIAWMIALAQLANGWEAVVCDEPSDLFRSFKTDIAQVFVADDAFGRTEYDPTMGAKWEKQLDRVLNVLDDRHWLLWTSRRHILERARHEMDLQGRAATIPDAAAVLVNAGRLSRLEKALILYRHAKSASLEAEAKRVLKSNVSLIIGDSAFTPERIRRFVNETLPSLVDALRRGELQEASVRQQIHEAIQNPTDRMIKSFRALSAQHKWILIALLEQGHSRDVKSLKERYDRLEPERQHLPFEQVLEELSEAFIRYES